MQALEDSLSLTAAEVSRLNNLLDDKEREISNMKDRFRNLEQ